jgi:hypothetical protein
MPEPKCILSLFDNSGAWSQPFWEEGHNIVEADIKNVIPLDVGEFSATWLMEEVMENFGMVDGILSAPPCTDFAASGAQYWKRKDLDGTTERSIHLVRQVLRCVEFCKPDWWILENPVGRIHKLVAELGAPTLIFDPCDFAGYLAPSDDDIALLDDLRARSAQGEQIDKVGIEAVKQLNAYTKKTCMWGEFSIPEKRRIEPVRVSAQGSWTQLLGGKSEATKAARSVTPEGFSRAFASANCWEEIAEPSINERAEGEIGAGTRL